MNKCEHNLNEKDNTLIKLNIKKMIYPNIIFCYCNICKREFKFIKNQEGNYELINNK